MKNNKGFIGIGLIIAIIIGVLAVGGGAYYFGTKNNSVPKVEENNFPQENQNSAINVPVLNDVTNIPAKNTTTTTTTNTTTTTAPALGSDTKTVETTVYLTNKDNGKNTSAVEGQIVNLELGKPVSLYGFDKPTFDTSVLQLISHEHLLPKAENRVPGDGGYEVFEFKVLKTGESKINVTMSQILDFKSEYASGQDPINVFSTTLIVPHITI